MKKKRMVTALLTTAMVFGAVPTAFAADNITVTVDGQKVSYGLKRIQKHILLSRRSTG